jgi:hypothetical protein
MRDRLPISCGVIQKRASLGSVYQPEVRDTSLERMSARDSFKRMLSPECIEHISYAKMGIKYSLAAN